ncbi:thiosulfate sulfurtransferase/rhodanese-like domain-containing protein 3 [Microcaecilia unicolor]|uniref:Thiosulfate sulfurtransferase/rhodanese-like domain-containing protein 3 n=1 Tax=Microcaecilia unicolor TaxID=1415580 RepID=A0A6P7XE77_9AMPH|nr:thiosulfate sulfurtransferase/rhodanese-like domain-containing protein 3 [Microcaecilia unicolor]
MAARLSLVCSVRLAGRCRWSTAGRCTGERRQRIGAWGSRNSLFCALSTAPGKTVSYEQLKDLLKSPKTVLVDVRERWEMKEYGSIPGALNIPLGEIVNALQMNPKDFEKKYNQTMPSKSDCVVFSCLAGVRSLKAFDSAVLLGYSRSQHYSGGFEDWIKHEMPEKRH